MKVAGYLRVSGKSQVDGDGFPRQREAVEKFCAANSLVLAQVFQEEGVSGTTDWADRPAFFEMVSCLESGDCIIAERMDRIARDLMASEMLLKECRSRGIRVYAADRGALVDVASDGADPTVVLIRQVLAAVAEFDKSSLVKKLRAAKDRIKAAGRRVDGTKPYGTLPGEDNLLTVILSQRDEGRSYADITNFLNASGALTRSGRKFKQQNVRDIVLNGNKRKNNK